MPALPRGGMPLDYEIVKAPDAPRDIAGRTPIVVDDGTATGATMRVALRATRRRSPLHCARAAPVAVPETRAALRPETDEIVCVEAPDGLGASGFFYRDFHQVSDAEVTDIPMRTTQREAAAR